MDQESTPAASPTFYDLARANRRAVRRLALVAGGTLGLPLVGFGVFLSTITSGPEGGPYTTALPQALPISVVVGLVVGLLRLGYLIGRRDDPDRDLARAGGILVEGADTPWLADPVTEIALAAGISVPRLARLSAPGVGVVGFGSGDRMIIAATDETATIPDDQRRAIVAYTIGLLLAEGASLSRLVRATSGVFDPIRALKVIYALAGGAIIFLEGGALVMAARWDQLTPMLVVMALSGVVFIPPILTGSGLLYVWLTFAVTGAVRSFVAGSLEDETAGLADALAVELNRDPAALIDFLDDARYGRVPRSQFADRGLAISGVLGYELPSETIATRVAALRALAGLAPDRDRA